MSRPVSIYVPSFNAERTLRACLESIFAQTMAFDEVIVIDDGSTDRTTELASTFDVRLARNPLNRGLAATRNVGLSVARNPLVAAVDSDCVLAEDWLETLLPYMERPEVSAVGGALLEWHTDETADLWRSKHMPQNWGRDLVINPPFLFGCNVLSNRETILGVGGYDEALWTNGEDVDISRKLKERGGTLVYDPRARARHLQRDTPISAMTRWWRWNNPLPKAMGAGDIAKRLPRNLLRALQYVREDAGDNPRLLLLDFAFPFAQVYLDAHGSFKVSGSRNDARGIREH